MGVWGAVYVCVCVGVGVGVCGCGCWCVCVGVGVRKRDICEDRKGRKKEGREFRKEGRGGEIEEGGREEMKECFVCD